MMSFSLEGDMIGKIRSKRISRRRAFSLLGALGFAAAPTVLKLSKADVPRAGAAPGRHKVALALQGGGSHGAFTWGVLDRILDDPTIEIIGVTGTSAGAMNAAALVGGLLRGGAQQAREELRRYWKAVGAMPGFGSFFSQMSGAAAAMTPLENIPEIDESKLVALRSAPVKRYSPAVAAHGID